MPPASEPPRIDYVVSRFPKTSETFIAREIAALEDAGEWSVGVRALFPSPESTAVHEVARRFVPRVRRPGVAAMLAGVLWALVRRPGPFLSALAVVVVRHRSDPRRLLRMGAAVAVAAAHARDMAADPPERVHAHYATYPAFTAWLCRRLVGVPYGFTAHAHDLYVDRTLLAVVAAEADYVVTISRYNRDLVLRETGIEPERVTIVHCGVVPEDYRFQQRALPPAGPLRALCVASLQEYKGHAVLLEALAKGGPGVDRIELDLVGEGVLAESLRAQVAALGLERRVRFLGGRSELQVRELLDRAHLFVLPSVVAADGQMEGLPVALIEALASGVPAVSTELSGIPEIVENGVTGLLAEPGSAAALRDRLEETIADPCGRTERSRRGRERVEREFDLLENTALLGRVLATARKWARPM
ncbi:glycosyltransferase [Pseudonocardia oroxyli]|uniref:Glycosyltransferase involved in cell wall bisynthesis n=1 Tax=Pseudonocardia oroxyli TaxID=366584 RepID=A0A1G7ZCU3_PSEOR|nr:glycosyltransferase [Pseudonocardia oroxyli]SDH06518.1 Glycosyltransferase involved in cell wall bisynthesis [Pseudonocardia oroxyli]